MWWEPLRSDNPYVDRDGRDVDVLGINFIDHTGSIMAIIKDTYADTGEPTGTGSQSRWTVIEKYESDGVTPNPKWVMMETEFYWIALDPAMTSVILHTDTLTHFLDETWVVQLDPNLDATLKTLEFKSLYTLNDGVVLGRVEIYDGDARYFGSDGQEISFQQVAKGFEALIFPGTSYVDEIGLTGYGYDTLRTYTQVSDVGNGLPVGSVVGTAEINIHTNPDHTGRDVIRVVTSFKDMTGRHLGHEISETYADTGEPTGVTGQSRWMVIEKYESDE